MRHSGLTAIVLAAAMVAACGGGSGGSTSTPTSPTPSNGGSSGSGGSGGTPTSSGTVTITIKGVNGKLSFDPNPASVGSGQTVVYYNADTVAHQIALDDGSLRTELIEPGNSSSAIAVGSRNSSYHCTIHPSMVGSFNAAATPEPPPCTGYCG